MGSEEAPMTWTLDGTEIRNAEGHKLASARYGPIKPCSMRVSEEERQEALQLMVKAPEMWAALYAMVKFYAADCEADCKVPDHGPAGAALKLLQEVLGGVV